MALGCHSSWKPEPAYLNFHPLALTLGAMYQRAAMLRILPRSTLMLFARKLSHNARYDGSPDRSEILEVNLVISVVLLGNYEPDRQESMQRFADLLHDRLRALGMSVEMVKPPVCFGRFHSGSPLFNKWLGYLDKYVLFPWYLRRLHPGGDAPKHGLIVHICDHSNAPYLRAVRGARTLVTCHDLLAVRSAFGEFPENPTGFFGRKLQRIILDGLGRSPHVACVSEATRIDLLRLSGLPAQQVSVVPNGLNYPYQPMPVSEAVACVNALFAAAGRHSPAFADGKSRGYILHVGGNYWYKNRAGVLHIYRRLLELMPDAPDLVMVGKPLPDSQRAWIAENGLRDRVITMEGADNEQLRALYSQAALLLFPSLAEGFGWPILEAQACGCTVVTANRQPMPEVGGNAAYYCNPRNFIESAALLHRVLVSSPQVRAETSERNRANVARFSTDAMIRGYMKLYERLLAN